MRETAAALRGLHRLLKQLADLGGRRDRGPKQIRSHEASIERLSQESAKAEAELKAGRMAVDQKQLQLRANEDKVADWKRKLSACSTNREYQALTEQIAAATMTGSVLEDEILDALSKVDTLKAAAVLAAGNVAKVKLELEKTRQSVDGQRQLIEADIARLETELRAAESKLPEDFLPQYQRMVRAKGDDALAEVDANFCGGCYQQLTPNTLNQLILGVSLACPNCGRFMYPSETRSARPK